MTTWGMSYQVENYLKSIMPMSMIFTMDGEGDFWALYHCGDGNYKWSREEAALFWTEQNYQYHPEQIYGMTGEMIPVMMQPQTKYTDHDVNMCWALAQQWGGFMVNPMAANCPVEVNWEEWVLYSSKPENRNVKFNLIGMG